MPVPDDPQQLAAHFYAQLLGFEISDDEPPLGSPLWCMLLVYRLAMAPALDEDEASRIVGNFLAALDSYRASEDE